MKRTVTFTPEELGEVALVVRQALVDLITLKLIRAGNRRAVRDINKRIRVLEDAHRALVASKAA
jgi:hypothetical protein